MRGIYAIVDVETLTRAKIDPVVFAAQLVVARPAALQLRAKTSTAREILRLLEALRPICSSAGIPLVNNDRVDLALATGCDMVHLGQDDLPIEAARRLDPKLGIGVSTHTPEQVALALKSRPTYVAYGPVFATASKENHDPVVGLEGLAQAQRIISASDAPHTPLVAIGGISAKNAHSVIAQSDMIAVIGALVSGDPASQLHALELSLGGQS